MVTESRAASFQMQRCVHDQRLVLQAITGPCSLCLLSPFSPTRRTSSLIEGVQFRHVTQARRGRRRGWGELTWQLPWQLPCAVLPE